MSEFSISSTAGSIMASPSQHLITWRPVMYLRISDCFHVGACVYIIIEICVYKCLHTRREDWGWTSLRPMRTDVCIAHGLVAKNVELLIITRSPNSTSANTCVETRCCTIVCDEQIYMRRTIFEGLHGHLGHESSLRSANLLASCGKLHLLDHLNGTLGNLRGHTKSLYVQSHYVQSCV